MSNKTFIYYFLGRFANAKRIIYCHVVMLVIVSLCAVSKLAAQQNPNDIIIDYSINKKSLSHVLVELSKRSGVNISFSENLIPKDSIVSFSYKQRSIVSVLKDILIDVPVDIKVLNGGIILAKQDVNKKFTIYGYIRDAESGEELINAVIYLPNQNISTFSNDQGYFSFKLPKGEYIMNVQYLAYIESSFIIDVQKDLEHDVHMKPLAMLNEIVIKNKYDQGTYSSNQGYEIPLDMVRSFVSIGGEANVMNLIGSTAGVSSSADQISGLSVRGGNLSHNLVLLDGVPVFNANHALGIFSVFNSDILKSVKFYKGAFPSRYSGRLSSVIDVKTKTGNSKKLTGNISIGTFSAKANIEGPILKDKATFILSMRRSTIDPWVRSALKFGNQDVPGSRFDKLNTGNFYLYDINGKLNFHINKKHHLGLSYYSGKDDFKLNKHISEEIVVDSTVVTNERLSINWKNNVYSLYLQSIWSNSFFSSVNLYSTSYDFNSFDIDRLEIISGQSSAIRYDSKYLRSNLKEIGFKLNIDYTGLNNHFIKFGTNISQTRYTPGLLIFNNEKGNSDIIVDESYMSDLLEPYEQSVINTSSYIEDEFLLFKNFYINLGVNTNLFFTEGDSKLSFDPRLSVLWKLGKVNLYGSYSRMSQFGHLLSNNGLGIPFNIWLPTTTEMELEKSMITSVGINVLTNNSIKFGLEFYYKKMSNLYAFSEGPLLQIDNSKQWNKFLPIGNVESYGAELSILKNIGKTIFDINYTYSFAINQFDEINKGLEYYGDFDRRHNLNISATQKINKNAEFSVTWKIAAGNPITIGSSPFISYDEEGNPFISFSIEAINNHLLPTYHRLDLGFNIYSDFSWGKQKISLGVVNAYNQKNPYYLDLKLRSELEFSYSQVYLLPILPSLTYSISFK